MRLLADIRMVRWLGNNGSAERFLCETKSTRHADGFLMVNSLLSGPQRKNRRNYLAAMTMSIMVAIEQRQQNGFASTETR